ncbi:LPS export ABC transporter periplasmic protein LptC [Candidatus Thioglobus sp.]|jgi:LPS export ABC transporter protein LptC|uniref:LPS export ABC transporter periplasmic protein LptC n=1 Tax=Candidatus Thioglobus sp. TaxID=2026721 RepID=UPI0025BCADBB|nr:LPS export ABC transporter periplasmic protein LptC [Candidatus Thioglobus sp.]
MNFQLRHNLLITTFIIVIIATMWLLMRGLSYSFDILQSKKPEPLTDNELVSKEVSYVEKIDHFALQEFDAHQRLSHFVEADQYYNFKNNPALLINPRVVTYDQQGEENYILTSKRANYLETGEVKFKGQVDVSSSNGVSHKMNTQELLVNTKTDDLVSDKKVTYLGENAKILSQGMHMQTKADKMKLTGDTVIHQDSGQKMLTKDLYIDQSNNQKHYYADNKTTYLSTENKIYAQGLDMLGDVTQLFGQVNILQNSGSRIDTKDLTVNQSNGEQLYTTDNGIHYQSNVADIRAKGMRYDAGRQKIKFTGGVVGQYD